MRRFAVTLIGLCSVLIGVCQQFTSKSFKCHDKERCDCTHGNPSRIKCTDFSSLAPNAFDNSKSNITNSIEIIGGLLETPLSRKVFTSFAPLGYRTIDVKNACVSDIEPLFFLYLLQNHTNLLWGVSITLSVCLVHIQAKTFYNLPQLCVLDLRANSIRSISNGAFSLLPSLESLLLQQNRLAEIDDSTFASLVGLRNLDLSSNDLVTISGRAFATLTNLESLRLNGNRLKRLVPGTFSSLTLNTLNLSHNKLEAFSRNLVRGTTRESLRSLYLTGNKITWLSEGVMDLDNSNPKLMELSLGGNPWVCTCALGWMKRRSNFIVQSSIRCAQPLILANKTLNTLSNYTLCSWENNKNREASTNTESSEGKRGASDNSEYIAIFSCVLLIIIVLIIVFAIYRFRDRIFRRRATPLPDKHPDKPYNSINQNSEDNIPFAEIHSDNDGNDTRTAPVHTTNNHVHSRVSMQHQGV